ncbi:helix-turn-helix domain-containing protein [Lysobacter sp.]|uniref:helix-turn-helix domain-containing protein n=1 Tax=Lysobacter sp. TaxID=72226 RepID=UPI002D4A7935|nr:helix-turn-helix domain-containing protein [Lysobacter sp.]HZX78220.1 helix-turn-helix domain-containing protein [Lysobacter sp.]
MNETSPLDLAQLQRSCARCSLQALCLQAGLTAQDVERLDGMVRRRRALVPGQRLFRIGDPLSTIYVARIGAFKTASITEQGEEQLVGLHLPGELIGLDALGEGAHRCEAIALSKANVCEVPFDQLALVAAQLPNLQHQLLRVIGQGVDRDHDHMALLARRRANERIALFLHGLGERFRQSGHSPTSFTLPLSREDVGRYLGVALETVSRGFTSLQDDGVIWVRGRRVEVLDPDELKRLAHGDEAGAEAAASHPRLF